MAASPQQALNGLRLARQCLAAAGARQTLCTRSPVLDQLGPLTCLVGSSPQQPLLAAPLAGDSSTRAFHAFAQRSALGSSDPSKATLPVGAALAAGAALTALTMGSVAADSGESRAVALPGARGCAAAVPVGAPMPPAAAALGSPAADDKEHLRSLRNLQLLGNTQEHAAMSVIESNKAAVVNIFVSRQPSSSGTSGPKKKPEVGLGIGAGFFFHHKGYNLILTSYHVVEGSSEPGVVKVRLSPDDETLYTALVVAGDMALDVAVLMAVTNTRCDTSQEMLQPVQPPHVVTLGSSSGLRPGQPVFALGSPPDLDRSFSSGVIGGLNRTVRFRDSGVRKGMVQTDATVSPGCSGGPLLDAAGHVVGINTGWGGWTCAVPIDKVKELLDQKGLLPALAVAAKAMGVFVALAGDRSGLVVTMVDENVAPAGIKPGDRIIGVDGRPVRSYADLANALSAKSAKSGTAYTVTLDILRSHTAPAGSSGASSSKGAKQQPPQQAQRRETVTVTLAEWFTPQEWKARLTQLESLA